MTPTCTIRRAVLSGLAATAMLTASLMIPGAAVAATRPAPGPAALLAGLPAGLAIGPGGLASLGTQPPAVTPGHVTPLWRLARDARPSRYPGQTAAPDTIGEPGGYDPAELRAYLGLHGTGAGQTIAVTEAYDVQNPFPVSLSGEQDDLTNSLAGYDSWYGLPPACSATVATGCFNLTFAAPHGTTTCPPLTTAGAFRCYEAAFGWMTEAVLDVELIHALVPQASITVVEGNNNANAAMMAALTYAQTLHPAVVSNSWSEDEFSGERALNSHCPTSGSPCVFSAGDNGNYAACLAQNGSSASCGGYPAANPNVLAVGGTTLNIAATGKVVSETAWSGGGGGISAYQPLPAYQDKADPSTSGRGVPDVSFDADPNSGVALYYQDVGLLGNSNTVWQEVGGTSVGAPAWSAILAAAGQLRAQAGLAPLTIAAVHADVYASARRKPVADITVGANGTCGAVCTAGPGYDLVTGEGSPRAGIDTYLASR